MSKYSPAADIFHLFGGSIMFSLQACDDSENHIRYSSRINQIPASFQQLESYNETVMSFQRNEASFLFGCEERYRYPSGFIRIRLHCSTQAWGLPMSDVTSLLTTDQCFLCFERSLAIKQF